MRQTLGVSHGKFRPCSSGSLYGCYSGCNGSSHFSKGTIFTPALCMRKTSLRKPLPVVSQQHRAEQRGGAATCGEEAGRETSRGRRAGSRKLALTVCQVLGWHLANAILVHVYETKETTFRRAVETEGSQPREQTFVSLRCHQQ